MLIDRPTLPDRYHQPWRGPFDSRIEAALHPGIHILDVGAGRNPTIGPPARPPACHYAGLDVSPNELEAAGPGAYNETWVQDAARRVPELEGRFDLIVSWQVLEHVRPLDAVFANLHAYLRPGGRVVAMLSGKFSAFSVINTVVPQPVGIWAMHRLLGRDPASVFPAYYDRCWHGAIARVLTDWSEVEVVPCYVGAVYFSFSGLLQRCYLAYEEWAVRNAHHNLATHYLISAVW
ncbi:MAG: class I SAM-dependent methyltransferase [Thermomicrobiales bacterium]